MPLLRSTVEGASGQYAVRAAEALFALTGDPDWASVLVAVLAGDESEYVRLDAAVALSAFPPVPSTVAALARAVSDSGYLIRYHSANTLLRYAGSRIDRESELFQLIATPAEGEASAEDRHSWERAAAQLTARLS